MKVPPAGIATDVWEDAVRAGYHATDEATRHEIEEILAAAVPVLGLVPAQASATEDSRR